MEITTKVTTIQTKPEYVLQFANNIFLEICSAPCGTTLVNFSQNCPNNRFYHFKENVHDVYAVINLFQWNTTWETLEEHLSATCKDYSAIEPNYVKEFKTGEIFEFFENKHQVQVFTNKEDSFYTLRNDMNYRQKIKNYDHDPVFLNAWLKVVDVNRPHFDLF